MYNVYTLYLLCTYYIYPFWVFRSFDNINLRLFLITFICFIYFIVGFAVKIKINTGMKTVVHFIITHKFKSDKMQCIFLKIRR